MSRTILDLLEGFDLTSFHYTYTLCVFVKGADPTSCADG